MGSSHHANPESATCLDLSFNVPQSVEINELTLVGKLITTRTINHKAIVSILSAAWNLGSNIKFHQLDRNTISCTFSRKVDRDRILDTGPWAVKGDILVLSFWPPERTLAELDLSWCSAWVQIHDIPPNRMNEDNATTIGNFIGRFISLEHNPQLYRGRKFLRIRVSFNTCESLKTGYYITREDGNRSWVPFKYERLPNFCYRCGLLDHVEQACPHEELAPSQRANPESGFGPWL